MPARPLLTAAASLLTAALLTAGWSETPAGAQRVDVPKTEGTAHDDADLASLADRRTPPLRVPGVNGRRVEVVAVGDIACAPGYARTATTCRHRETARLTKRLDPEAVLALGDLQYEEGSLYGFRHSYDRSWGDLKKITYPIPGNHEYRTAGAKGYYSYFSTRQPGAPGYYTTNLGRWRVYALNGNCANISCDREARWFKRRVGADEGSCSLVTVHFPRYSSGEHGNQRGMRRFFRIAFRHGVDLMLTGHDHHYERFRPLNHKGDVVDRGVTQFVSGGGGKSHYPADGRVKGSAYVEDDTFGVLRLVLRPDSFRYGFRGIDGSKQDNGSRSCV